MINASQAREKSIVKYHKRMQKLFKQAIDQIENNIEYAISHGRLKCAIDVNNFEELEQIARDNIFRHFVGYGYKISFVSHGRVDIEW